ncbi:MAG TPA: hypothetical protein VGA67_00690 [Candidatus Dojkabacteria bacterium]|jgi:hypothetical protein
MNRPKRKLTSAIFGFALLGIILGGFWAFDKISNKNPYDPKAEPATYTIEQVINCSEDELDTRVKVTGFIDQKTDPTSDSYVIDLSERKFLFDSIDIEITSNSDVDELLKNTGIENSLIFSGRLSEVIGGDRCFVEADALEIGEPYSTNLIPAEEMLISQACIESNIDKLVKITGTPEFQNTSVSFGNSFPINIVDGDAKAMISLSQSQEPKANYIKTVPNFYEDEDLVIWDYSSKEVDKTSPIIIYGTIKDSTTSDSDFTCEIRVEAIEQE